MAEDLEIARLITLNRIPSIGGQTIRNLISAFGNTEEIFKAKNNHFTSVDGIGKKLANSLYAHLQLDVGMRELEFIHKKNIQAYSWYDNDFPHRLKNCADSPVLLFAKGKINWNAQRIVSIVGTRKSTPYGLDCTEQLIAEMADKGNYIVVSGLAYGIDGIAHRACLKHQVPTWGVLAHGLDQIYPTKHRELAKDMLYQQGALITEFTTGTAMVPNNFLSRNRIVAGLSSCTVVVESAAKGGSLVTADIANSYNHDVFAFPGRNTDKYSAGCNQLIKSNQAHLMHRLSDLEYIMDWQQKNKAKPEAQRQLFIELSAEEEALCKHLSKEPIFIDVLCHSAQIPISKALSLLFSLEFKGVVRSHVGKMYSLI
ncbi:MAG: DNA-processing protein DprA [Mangrovibacterium sp.]